MIASCTKRSLFKICEYKNEKIIRFPHFILFSNVDTDKVDSYTRVIPYSVVRIKDLGRSSQGTIAPSFCANSKKRLVRADVDVLSISNIPITELSRTAISLPMFIYIPHPPFWIFLPNYRTTVLLRGAVRRRGNLLLASIETVLTFTAEIATGTFVPSR